MPEVVLSPERLAEDADAIAKIDERLGDTDGATSKTKLRNQLVRDVEDSLKEKQIHNQLIAALQQNYSGPDIFGAYYALQRELDNWMKDRAEEYLKETVAASQAEAEPISKEEAEQLATERQVLLERYAKAYEYLSIFGMDMGNLPEPKSLGAKTRKSSPRGKQELSLVSWQVDGEAVNGLKEIAEKVGFEKAGEVRKALKDQGVSTSKGEVPDNINVTINGHSVVGVKSAA